MPTLPSSGVPSAFTSSDMTQQLAMLDRFR
jgi:hypothetical protein